jgi:hypothetical protein
MFRKRDLSRRSNMVTNDLVDRVTDRTGIQRGGCCGRHRACSIREARRDYMVGLPGLNSFNLAQQEKTQAWRKRHSPDVHDKAGVQFLDRPGRRGSSVPSLPRT